MYLLSTPDSYIHAQEGFYQKQFLCDLASYKIKYLSCDNLVCMRVLFLTIQLHVLMQSFIFTKGSRLGQIKDQQLIVP